MAVATQTAEQTETLPPAARPAAPRPRPDKQDKPDVPPPWRVLLHNDEVNIFDHVIHILHRLMPLSMAEATERTNQAHLRGRAVLLSTHKERAELYVEQLTSAGLTVTMEEDN